MKKSGFLRLNWLDFLKGALVAVLSPVFVILQQSLESGDLTFDYKAIGAVALAGFLAYLSKNLFEGEKNVK